MRIGEVAQRTGCSPETIRHYEKLRLLAPPQRAANGYREYTPDAVKRLGFIRNGRALGLDLETISELLELVDEPEADCSTADRIAQRHLQVVEERIASLTRLAEELRTVIAQCQGGRVADCGIIEALYPQRAAGQRPLAGEPKPERGVDDDQQDRDQHRKIG